MGNIERYLWLIFTVYVYKEVTFEQLQELWQKYQVVKCKPLSLRTFHAHRKIIKDLFNVEIVCDKKNNSYKYYIGNLENLSKETAGFRKYCAAILSNTFYHNWSLNQRTLFGDIAKGVTLLPIISECEYKGKELVMHIDGRNGRTYSFRFCPYGFKFYNGKWYVIGRENSPNFGMRNVAIEDIVDINLAGFDFPRAIDFNIEDYLENCIGVDVPAKAVPKDVTLRVYAPYKFYLEKHPLHHTQVEKYNCSSFSTYEYKLYITDELVSEIIKMGENVKVMHPEELRIKVRNKIKKMLDVYNTFS